MATFPRCAGFLALLAPFVFASTEMANAQLTADANPANASNNPLTPKLTFYLQNFYMPSVTEESNRDTDEVLLRLYVPYTAYGIQNSLRIYAPIETVPVAPGRRGVDSGFGDVMIFDLILKQIGNLMVGGGPYAVLPTSSHADMGSKTWQGGPAAIAIQRFDWGLVGATFTYSIRSLEEGRACSRSG